MLQMKPAASGKPGRLRVTCGMLAAGILLLTCLSSFPAVSDACTGFCAGCETTANGSAYVCRSEDFGPDYAKQFVIVPAAENRPVITARRQFHPYISYDGPVSRTSETGKSFREG